MSPPAEVESATPPAWVATLQGLCMNSIESVRFLHQRAREKLDLDLETSPMEGTFSHALIDLMSREEAAFAQGKYDVVKQVEPKIDSLLQSETDKHFRVQSDQHQKKWMALFRHQVLERDRLFDQINSQLGVLCRRLQLAVPSEETLTRGTPPPQKTAARDGEGEEERLERLLKAEEKRVAREAYASMGDSEKFHLDNAFRLQLRRIDVEWGTHEAQIQADYDSKKAEIEGRTLQKKTVKSPVGPWKSKEKQRSLIHTAPVFEPTIDSPMSKKTRAEMVALDTAFGQAMKQLQHQKDNAKKWIRRQSLRMYIQAKYIGRERKALAQHLEQQDAHLEVLSTRVAAYVSWVQAKIAEGGGVGDGVVEGVMDEVFGGNNFNGSQQPQATTHHYQGMQGPRFHGAVGGGGASSVAMAGSSPVASSSSSYCTSKQMGSVPSVTEYI